MIFKSTKLKNISRVLKSNFIVLNFCITGENVIIAKGAKNIDNLEVISQYDDTLYSMKINDGAKYHRFNNNHIAGTKKQLFNEDDEINIVG